MQRRLDDALTQNPARPTRLPRFGKTLTRLICIGTAAPKESSHRATQAEIHACQVLGCQWRPCVLGWSIYPAGAWRRLVSREKSFRFHWRKENSERMGVSPQLWHRRCPHRIMAAAFLQNFLQQKSHPPFVASGDADERRCVRCAGLAKRAALASLGSSIGRGSTDHLARGIGKSPIWTLAVT